PLGAAAMGYVLWQEFLKHNPRDPEWFDRDRFVLSAGHGSMLIYSLLHLTGYDVSLDDLKSFRKIGSKTPGHPERGHTPGVEVTTGPLGQGVGNGVGLAMAEQFLAAKYNRPDHEIIDHYTYGIISDGDVMEGVAFEAAAIAGTLKLGKLIYLYDQNHMTLAASANVTLGEDVAGRFEALGWHVQTIDGLNPDEVRQAIEAARAETERPSLICCRTVIGYGSPNKADTFGVHGSPLGADEVVATKENLGLPTDEKFYVFPEALDHFREALDKGADAEARWRMRWDAYQSAFPEEAAELERAIAGEIPEGWDADIPTWEPDPKGVATRKASSEVMNAFFEKLPTFIGGSADLNPSTNTVMKGGGDFMPPGSNEGVDVQGSSGGPWNYTGRNVHFGIREHGMGAIVNGMAAHGGVIPFSATFLTFSDYQRPSIRLAALSKLHSIYVFTHDSIAVGEDGPTHEPIEHTMSLRLIPDLLVLRPGDANETADAWRIAVESKRASALVFSRQDLPVQDRAGAKGGVRDGAYILADSEGEPDIVLLATGSELELAVEARKELEGKGIQARVVSMPCWELFDAKDDEYKASVLGPAGTPRVSVEAGTTIGWSRYTGDNGAHVGIDTYGASGPGNEVLKHFGFTVEKVTATALDLLGRHEEAAAYRSETDQEAAGPAPEGDEGHS
ncbi:MAG TPA: transketolase, partial [Thermomicrobiales bacterium]|nr:transketolase [Thermomicrobiales bacterium]